MSTGLTFGTISALFGLTHGYTDPAGTFHTYIDQAQYSILVTVVIGSAIVPTMIAQGSFPEVLLHVISVEVVGARVKYVCVVLVDCDRRYELDQIGKSRREEHAVRIPVI